MNPSKDYFPCNYQIRVQYPNTEEYYNYPKQSQRLGDFFMKQYHKNFHHDVDKIWPEWMRRIHVHVNDYSL